MSIRKRGKRRIRCGSRHSRRRPAPTREAAERMELDLKRRRSLGRLYEEPSITLGEAIDGALERIEATRASARKDARVQPAVREVLGAAAERASLESSGGRRSRT